jgi:hypothetical protein
MLFLFVSFRFDLVSVMDETIVLGCFGDKELIDFEIEVRLDHDRLSKARSRDWPVVL